MPHTTRVLRSEWTKIRSVRSTLWTLATRPDGHGRTVGCCICACHQSEFDKLGKQEQLNFDPTYTSFSGSGLGQLAMIVFGVLVVSGEYSTGMIRTSLAAVPQRAVFLFSKIAVAPDARAAWSGWPPASSAFFLGQALLGDRTASRSSDKGVLRAVVGGGLYMTLIALFSMGVDRDAAQPDAVARHPDAVLLPDLRHPRRP